MLTAVLSLLLVLAIGVGAFALGPRFRLYSFATLVSVIVFGAPTGPLAARLAAGQPTPGSGSSSASTFIHPCSGARC